MSFRKLFDFSLEKQLYNSHNLILTFFVFDVNTKLKLIRFPCLFSETVKIRQAQVDKLYEGLKDLAEERRGKLDETLKLYQLQGEIDDLEQWIAEKEVVAGSQDIGQDLAQVEVHISVSTINSIRCSFRTLFFFFFRLVQIRNLKFALIRALSLIDCTKAREGAIFCYPVSQIVYTAGRYPGFNRQVRLHAFNFVA